MNLYKFQGSFCVGADLKERAKMTPAEVGPFVAKGKLEQLKSHTYTYIYLCLYELVIRGGNFEYKLKTGKNLEGRCGGKGKKEEKGSKEEKEKKEEGKGKKRRE